MKTITQNIHFHYKYRDAANYKAYGSVIFSNPTGFTVKEVAEKLQEVLIDGSFFIPTACNIPLIHSFPFDPELDHEWYELDYVKETSGPATDSRSIDAFIRIMNYEL